MVQGTQVPSRWRKRHSPKIHAVSAPAPSHRRANENNRAGAGRPRRDTAFPGGGREGERGGERESERAVCATCVRSAVASCVRCAAAGMQVCTPHLNPVHARRIATKPISSPTFFSLRQLLGCPPLLLLTSAAATRGWPGHFISWLDRSRVRFALLEHWNYVTTTLPGRSAPSHHRI